MTILSSLSQEEARSISENVTWGLRKKFQDGKFSVGYSLFPAYDKGEDGNLAIRRWYMTEEEIKAAFVTAFHRLVTERAGASCASEEIAANARLVRQTLCDTTALAEEKGKLQQELAVLVEMTEKAVMQNARIAQDQEEYQRRYNSLVERYDAAKARFEEVTETISAKEAQAERLAMFERTLKDQTEPVADDGALVLQHLVPHMRSEEEKFDSQL